MGFGKKNNIFFIYGSFWSTKATAFQIMKKNYWRGYLLPLIENEVCCKQNGIVRQVNNTVQKYFLLRYLSQVNFSVSGMPMIRLKNYEIPLEYFIASVLSKNCSVV